MTTQTIASKGRIFPSSDAETAIANIIREIEGKLEVQWDGVTWTDESDYFLSAKGNNEISGNWGEGMASEADFELDNTTGRFLPENASSPLYNYLTFRKNIRFSVVIGSYEFRIFTGYIKAIEPNRKQGIVNFHCFDNTVKVLNVEAPEEAAYINKRANELIQILAEAAGMSEDEYDLEISEHIISAAYFADRNIWPLMGEIALSERGRVFFDYDGKLKFWNKEHIEKQQVAIFTLTRDNWIKNLEFSIEEQAIKNYVSVKARPRISAGIKVVWDNGDIEILNQYSDTLVWIPANDSQNAYIQAEDEYGALPCTNWIQPIAYTDYTANTAIDGSGTDMTDSVKITTFNDYASEAFIVVQNYSDQDIYLTKFQVRANPLEIWDWIRVIKRDESSIDQYGKQSITLENDFIDTEEWAESLAQTELDRWNNAKNLFKVDILGVPQIKVGDVVSVELTESNFEDYMIEMIDWEVDDHGYTQQLRLVNKLTIPVYNYISARANIYSSMSQSITAKASIVRGEEITAKASIKINQTQTIEVKGLIVVLT